jgi:hypothetical protein
LYSCFACDFAASLDPSESQLLQDQLNITRTKMEAIRRKLEKQRLRREARKQQQQQQQSRSYSTAWSLAAAAASSSGRQRPPAGEEGASDAFLPAEPEIVTA